ncbi:hypothetical protein DVK02_11910 [Halobellus sp. Atlit-31R]|nr:hypothetical protein DVK02_11910 [Halobellus sp. Atlit-31R]
MTGMKRGAGEDPFADDGDGGTAASDQTAGSDGGGTVDSDADGGASSTPPEDDQPTTRRSMQIPYKFRRDGVQDGRSRVPLFLQPETKTAERDTLRDLEDRFGDDVSLTDLREALVMVGLEHLDEVEAQLEEWGYGMTFE